MMKIVKQVFLLSILLFCFAITTQNASAAGVYYCKFDASAGGCVVSQDECGPNFKANCAQFTTVVECQYNQNAAGNADCIPDVTTPPDTPPGSCSSGTCTTSADCSGATCRGATGVACTGICDCPASKCNYPTDCRGQLSTCTGVDIGAWCSGTCFFSEEDPAPFPTTAQMVQGTCALEGTVDSAIGCIPYTLVTRIVSFFLAWGLGVGGGVVFLTILAGGFQIMTSSGDPAKMNGGKEILASAISGLLMLIFSIFLLRLIGVNILGLF